MEYKDIYEKIYEYCKVKSLSASENGTNTPPRVNKIIEILDSLNIPYTHESFVKDNSKKLNIFHNIYCKGDSTLVFTAHHDITGNSEGANDNSASVINLIALKILRPEANIAFTDGEEIGGVGAKQLAKNINSIFPDTTSILNLELTGLGGKRFFLGKSRGRIQYISEFIKDMDKFKGMHPIPEVNTPFNDSVIFNRYEIDSVVINPLPPLIDNKPRESFLVTKNIVFTDGTPLDSSIITLCNGRYDTIDTISIDDMKEFVEEVLVPIFDEWQDTNQW